MVFAYRYDEVTPLMFDVHVPSQGCAVSAVMYGAYAPLSSCLPLPERQPCLALVHSGADDVEDFKELQVLVFRPHNLRI